MQSANTLQIVLKFEIRLPLLFEFSPVYILKILNIFYVINIAKHI